MKTKLILNSVPKSGGHFFQEAARVVGYSEYPKGCVFTGQSYVKNHCELLWSCVKLKHDEFMAVHFYSTRLSQIIFQITRCTVILIDRDPSDTLVSTVDFVMQDSHPYALNFRHLTRREVAKLIIDGINSPLEHLHPKTGKLTRISIHGLRDGFMERRRRILDSPYPVVVYDKCIAEDPECVKKEFSKFLKLTKSKYCENEMLLLRDLSIKKTSTFNKGINGRGIEFKTLLNS